MKYGSVILDMDGVILDFRGDSFQWKYDAVREALEQMGIDPGEMDREELDIFLGDRGVSAVEEKAGELGIPAEEIWELVAERTTEARKIRIDQNVFRLFDDVKPALQEMREKEIALGLISNAPEGAVRITLQRYDLKRYFKFFRGVENYEDMKAGKPHPDHLEIARAELKRPEYVFAGDACSDLVAADRAGMASAWVRRNGEQIDYSPDYSVEDLGELVGRISQA